MVHLPLYDIFFLSVALFVTVGFTYTLHIYYSTKLSYLYVKKVGCFVQEILYTCTSISRGGEFLGFRTNPQLLMLEIFDIFNWTMTNAVLTLTPGCKTMMHDKFIKTPVKNLSYGFVVCINILSITWQLDFYQLICYRIKAT